VFGASDYASRAHKDAQFSGNSSILKGKTARYPTRREPNIMEIERGAESTWQRFVTLRGRVTARDLLAMTRK